MKWGRYRPSIVPASSIGVCTLLMSSLTLLSPPWNFTDFDLNELLSLNPLCFGGSGFGITTLSTVLLSFESVFGFSGLFTEADEESHLSVEVERMDSSVVGA